MTIVFRQQGDDPPYLPVGTDVSAKYKGAFCEAKIKNVVRNIKCKVSYKCYSIEIFFKLLLYSWKSYTQHNKSCKDQTLSTRWRSIPQK